MDCRWTRNLGIRVISLHPFPRSQLEAVLYSCPYQCEMWIFYNSGRVPKKIWMQSIKPYNLVDRQLITSGISFDCWLSIQGYRSETWLFALQESLFFIYQMSCVTPTVSVSIVKSGWHIAIIYYACLLVQECYKSSIYSSVSIWHQNLK